MSVDDQNRFTEAMKKAVAETRGDMGKRFTDNWRKAVVALNGLAMPDMLAALKQVSRSNADDVVNFELSYSNELGPDAVKRFRFARSAVFDREIINAGILADQANDGREFLGCTRMSDGGVQRIIDDSIQKAKDEIHEKRNDTGMDPYLNDSCCGALHYAWLRILVPKRRQSGASLIADLAAAAHYMLTRYHVCSANASVSQMKTVINAYDEKKRSAIKRGDVELKSMAIKAGSRPFPPDFGILSWAVKGATEGDADRQRCNPNKELPTIFPDIDGNEV